MPSACDQKTPLVDREHFLIRQNDMHFFTHKKIL